MRKNHPARVFIKKKFPGLFKVISGAHQRIRWFFIWRKAGLSLRDELAAYRSLSRAEIYKPLAREGINAEAVHYVGTKESEGIAQLAILMHYGCQPFHRVLEIGCGALNAGYPIMQYLEKGNYHGIEPNQWLIEDSRKLSEVDQEIKKKDARFAYNENFDGSLFQTKFDYVISHSILSHAAHWQWPLFLKNVDACMKRGSTILASLHFTDGNAYGDNGYQGTELDFTEWVYPGVSYFRKETLEKTAREYGYSLAIDLVPSMLITNAHPVAHHSWIVLRKQ
jgi:hypothetical protein